MPDLNRWPMQCQHGRAISSVLTRTDMLTKVMNKDCRIETCMIVNTITATTLVGLQAAVVVKSDRLSTTQVPCGDPRPLACS